MSSSAPAVSQVRPAPATKARPNVWVELLTLGALYFVYSVVRSTAGGRPAAARASARTILEVERHLGVDVEQATNAFVHRSGVLSLLTSYWYASAHFLVTGAVLVLLYRARPSLYRRMRTALVSTTGIALGFFVAMPTAPPRLLGGPYVDVLVATSEHGWWAGNGSAPRGLAGATNEFAAFPSMHAGWSLWVLAAALLATRSVVVRVTAAAYATATAVDIVATANHWTLDVLAGWLITLLVVWACVRRQGASEEKEASDSRLSPADAAGPTTAGSTLGR